LVARFEAGLRAQHRQMGEKRRGRQAGRYSGNRRDAVEERGEVDLGSRRKEGWSWEAFLGRSAAGALFYKIE